MPEKQENITKSIETILFYLAEPVDFSTLTKTLEISKKELESGLAELGEILKERGVKLVIHNDEVSLVTTPELSLLIEKLIKEEREKDLGRAGIETLSIVAYKGPVSKKNIEYIRGVNSQYALRNLLLRGLIERKNSPIDNRVVLYGITGDTLRYLGLGSISDLPEYTELKAQLEVPIEMEDTEVEE